jgi:hypothetical protein
MARASKFGYVVSIMFLLCHWITPSVPKTWDKLKIAVILAQDNSRMFSIPKVKPAIEYAVDSLHPNILAIPKENISIQYADSKCNSINGPIAAIDFHHKDQVHVFFGPVCDYSLAPVARYAPFWDTPIISPGGMAHDFGLNKSEPGAEFPNLTRVGWTFDSLAEYLETAIYNFNWTRFKVLYDPRGHGEISDSFCYLAISAFIRRLRLKQSDLTWHLYNFVSSGSEEYNKMFTEEVGGKYSGKNKHRNLS